MSLFAFFTPFYWLIEWLLGPRSLKEMTNHYAKRESILEAITIEGSKLVISCRTEHYHVHYPRFGIYRHYLQYHVCAEASGTAEDTFKKIAGFCVTVPATYPPYMNLHYGEEQAINHYLNELRSRLNCQLYREI